MPSKVPIQQDHACKEIGETSAVHPDKKIQKLYVKLQNMKGKWIDFVKQKNNKPFIPAYSKYIDVPDRRVCWHCGMSGHLRPLCPQREHLWGNVPSNVKTSVQDIPNVPLRAKSTRPVKMIWVWVPKLKV